MSARHRLNIASINGCLLIAAIIGLATQRWSVFLVALALLIASGVYLGDIRLKPRR